MLQERKNQALVISGESGAGKTETNKECLKFISQYFRSGSADEENSNMVEKAIFLSNPILEAFGNAKTIRNNNSSRFGKYLSISIDKNNQIKKAEFYNYLLEKSRLINRAEEEQNFHILYEFISKLTLA